MFRPKNRTDWHALLSLAPYQREDYCASWMSTDRPELATFETANASGWLSDSCRPNTVDIRRRRGLCATKQDNPNVARLTFHPGVVYTVLSRSAPLSFDDRVTDSAGCSGVCKASKTAFATSNRSCSTLHRIQRQAASVAERTNGCGRVVYS